MGDVVRNSEQWCVLTVDVRIARQMITVRRACGHIAESRLSGDFHVACLTCMLRTIFGATTLSTSTVDG